MKGRVKRAKRPPPCVKGQMKAILKLDLFFADLFWLQCFSCALDWKEPFLAKCLFDEMLKQAILLKTLKGLIKVVYHFTQSSKISCIYKALKSDANLLMANVGNN